MTLANLQYLRLIEGYINILSLKARQAGGPEGFRCCFIEQRIVDAKVYARHEDLVNAFDSVRGDQHSTVKELESS